MESGPQSFTPLEMQLATFFSVISLLSVLTVVQGRDAPPMNHVGKLFIFDPGLGACGFTNTSSQIVASVSQQVFTSYPGATTNPNNNPICRQSVSITFEGKSLNAQIVDFFTDPGQTDNLGLSRPGFRVFADESDGIVENVPWTIIV